MLSLVPNNRRPNYLTWTGFCLLALVVLLGFLGLAAAPALADGLHYELVNTVPDVRTDSGWSVAVGDIVNAAPAGNYKAESKWSAPPGQFDASGFDMTVTAIGTSVDSNLKAGTGLSGDGFTFDKDPPGIDTYVEGKGTHTDSKSLTIHVTPDPSYGDGETIELDAGMYYGPHVAYTYKVVGTASPSSPSDEEASSEDQSSSDDSQSSSQEQSNLAVQIDCPSDITIGAPDLNCHLIISGFRHNTADPIEVSLPDGLDTFGNHANGIQLDQIAGEQDVYNMDDPYSWGFFAFACAAPSHVGHNCYNNADTSGPASVPIVVSQGEDQVRVDLAFSVIAGAGPNGPSGPSGPQVRIGNRWIAGGFINIEHGGPEVTGIALAWPSAIWTLDPSPNGAVLIHSVARPDIYLYEHDGELGAGPVDPGDPGAQWTRSAHGRYTRFASVGQPDIYLNTESGHLQATKIGDDWASADWWLLR